MGSDSHHAKAMSGHWCERGQILPHVSRVSISKSPWELRIQTTFFFLFFLSLTNRLSYIFSNSFRVLNDCLASTVNALVPFALNSSRGYDGLYRSITVTTVAAGHSWSVGVCRHYHLWDSSSLPAVAIYTLVAVCLTRSLCSFQLKSCHLWNYLNVLTHWDRLGTEGFNNVLRQNSLVALSGVVVVVVKIFNLPLVFIMLLPTLWTLEPSPRWHWHSVPWYQSQPAVDGGWPEWWHVCQWCWDGPGDPWWPLVCIVALWSLFVWHRCPLFLPDRGKDNGCCICGHKDKLFFQALEASVSPPSLTCLVTPVTAGERGQDQRQ